jgi:transposase
VRWYEAQWPGLGAELFDAVVATIEGIERQPWQRLPAFQKLGQLLTRRLDGIVSYCHEPVPFGKVEAINGNLRAMLRRGRGYRDHEYLLLKVQRATASRHHQAA